MAWAGSYRAAPAVQDFTSSATTYSVTKAAGVVAGDLILLWCTGAGYPSTSYTCPGFAAYAATFNAQILSRTADGTEGSTFTVTNVAGSHPAEITQVVIAGPCSIDVVGASNKGLTAANPTATGLTVAGPNELLLWFGAAETDSGGTGVAVATTIPSGFTQRLAGTTGTTNMLTALLCDNTAVAPGATGSVAATNASTANDWSAQMVAIQPLARPQYRATPAVQDYTAASTYAVNKATGTVAGDLILLWCAGQNATQVYSCTGFAAASTTGSLSGYGQLLYRTADGTESSTFTVAVNNSAAAEITQATIAGPCSIDVIGAWNSGVPSTNPSATGLTVAGANELLLWFGSADNSSGSTGAAVATSVPSGLTSRVAGTAGTSLRPTALLCDNTTVAAGATGSVAATNATSNVWQAQMVAIQPLARPGPYRGTPSFTYTSAGNQSTALSVTKQSGTAAGDLILLAVASWTNYAGTGAVGYTSPGFTAGTKVYDSSANFGYQLLYRTADGTEGSTYAVTPSLAAGFTVAQIVIENAVIDVAGTVTVDSGISNTIPITGVTPASNADWLLWIAGAMQNASVLGENPSPPGGMVTQASDPSTGVGNVPGMIVADNEMVGSGATGTLTGATAFNANSFWAGQQIAVKRNPAVVSTQGLLLMLMMS